jgi:hypothetical protein
VTPQRYEPRSFAAVVSCEPAPQGDYVRFADVEQALRDSACLAWLMPIISGEDCAVANARTAALGVSLALGFAGTALVDEAMRRCP